MRKTSLTSGWEVAAADWLEADGGPVKLGYSRLEWLPARVPGHVHLDLVRNGVIGDPFRQRGELGVQWVDEARWSYRRVIRGDALGTSARHQVLRFEGLDTLCTVSLRGEVVAKHENMHCPLEVDITGKLLAGDNELRVDFESASRIGWQRRREFLAQEGLPQDVPRFPERAFVRKAQYMFAWDWGPRLVSVGLWKPVDLLEFDARLLDVVVAQRHLPGGEVELECASEVQGGGCVWHRLEGRAEWFRDGQAVSVANPELWWPHGLGNQRLYRVESVLVPEGSQPSRPEVLDRRQQRIGLRTIRLLRERDRQGESFEFEINGRKLWAMGANWIPDHSFPSVVDRERIARQVLRARDMRMNMLRVWGGGLYESDEFYDVCDELGLLVWQDFPFACSYVPDLESEQASLAEEAAVNIKRLRNHASLALWCGNNENLTMWDSKWEAPKPQPGRYYGEHLYDEVLPRVVRELDPSRGYVASSPIGGANANDGDVGDQHFWDVWHGRGDWKHYRDSTARFASEFGFASAPGRSVWQKIYAGQSQWQQRDVRDALARYHDKTGKGYDTYVGYVELHYPRARDIEEFLYTSQLNQRDALRFGIEHYRRSSGCRGALIWQLNDCWPVQSWAVVDCDGNYKAAAFELRRLYANALVSIDHEPGRHQADIWVMWDNAREALASELVVEVFRLADGERLERKAAPVSLQPDQRENCLRLDVSAWAPAHTLVTARLACGRFPGSETFRLLAEPKQAELSLPEIELGTHPRGVEVHCSRPVVDLMLWDPEDGATLRDNFVTLPAGGRRVLEASGAWQRLCARSLAGIHPVRG